MSIERTLEVPIGLKEAAELLGYKPSYIYYLVHYKKIPFRKSGKLRFLKSELIEFMKRNRSAADYEVSEKANDILNGVR